MSLPRKILKEEANDISFTSSFILDEDMNIISRVGINMTQYPDHTQFFNKKQDSLQPLMEHNLNT